MQTKKHEDLIVWQKAIELATEVYRLSGMMPGGETHTLTDQMKKTAVSIPSSIAQGQDSSLTKEYLRRLHSAKGSKSKLETQLLICVRLKYLTVIEIETAQALLSEIGRILDSIISEPAIAHWQPAKPLAKLPAAPPA